MKQKKKNRQVVSAAELRKYEAIIYPDIQKIIKNLGFNLLDVSFVNENQENYLRLTVAHEDHPISIDDCEIISRNVGKGLDLSDLIPIPYILEVQSKGTHENCFKEQRHEFILETVGLTVRS